MADDNPETSSLELATELTIAWLSNPNTRASAEDVPAFLQRMHGAVSALSSPQQQQDGSDQQQQEFTPAVSARKSLASKDHIISMIDGKPYKTLRRHLARHGLTPEQYRERYGLKSDYPMVSESYSEVRRNMAKQIGLGRKRRGADEAQQQPENNKRRAAGDEQQRPAGGKRGRPRKAVESQSEG